MLDNLAGRSLEQVGVIANREFAICGIRQLSPIQGDLLLNGEPVFAFLRSRNHYTVWGKVPIETSKALWKDPAHDEILIMGQNTSPTPDHWFWFTTDDKLILTSSTFSALKDDVVSPALNDFVTRNGMVFLDRDENLPEDAVPNILMYTITSLVGLRVFVDTLRAHGLVNLVEPPIEAEEFPHLSPKEAKEADKDV